MFANNEDRTNIEELINSEKKRVSDEFPEYEVLLIYGKKFTREEWLLHMKSLWSDDMNDVDIDFQQDLLNECSMDLQTDYGINTWTWQQGRDGYDNSFQEFFIGHRDYFVLSELLEKNDNIKHIISDIDWYIITGDHIEDIKEIEIDNVMNIEDSKTK